ncbi:MAG: lactate utilization protein [Desulfocapsaceae bacterium]|nr:lactate utilization protein [Desulfocapsaceae bacterium]
MDERGLFLASIRKALGFSGQNARSAADCSAIFNEKDDTSLLETIKYRTHVEKQALLQIFLQNSEELNLAVHPVQSLARAADAIVEIVGATTPEFGTTKQIIQHDHPDIAELQLWKRFSDQAVHVHTSYAADQEVRDKTIESYIGLTVPGWAVAESATVIELSASGRPRSISLLPSVHIAMIRLDYMLADLSELYALLRQEPPEHSYVFISGPSKTADIEAHMVHGAHGPREMHVIVIDEQLENSINYKGSGLFPT